ncbi:carboxymuconolactone decarboxylase family protein (plasmid) [Lichenicola cladoniae]|uniref:Carboxymuconolactone decarboxylase family protein n=1 Tax=Lichenicola cladoniae TaxID=1484109 RepID=A0A6M8I0D9_9PROT|nr:carboxymuconolactone decarboxylase family protein [Lichenicola cladoniae]NPD69298.1 carboxymuconolactone decarboxylase family protein [Acetobacteraceae bacterium]QKE93886.1 carboxymuconolactone decarboxylase family protein [Lichenicola cladoniae]
MKDFILKSIETAPVASRPALQQLQAAFGGTLPNIARAMSTSSVLIDSLVVLFGKVHGGSFSEPQIQVVLLTDAVANEANWAVAFHSFLALQAGLANEDVEAIRNGRAPAEAKLGALSTLARTLIEKRGHITEAEGQVFLAQGFGRDHLLEVIAIVAASTITNYTANVTEPPLEPEFQPYAWTAPSA